MPKNQHENLYSEEKSEKLKKWGFNSGVFLIGIILPTLTLLVELYTQICADSFIDPIPTLWQALLVAFVPISNFYLFWCLWKERYERATLFGWASAVTMGIAIVYSMIFLPVSPISVFAIILMGLGFLGLSPMFALLATFLMRRRFRKETGNSSFILSWKGTLVGFLMALSVFAICESEVFITRHGMEMASSNDVASQKQGLDLLQRFGDEDYLLKLSRGYKNNYYASDTAYSMFSRSSGYSTEKAREIFYRLSGKSPENTRLRSRFGFGFDNSQTRANWRNGELSLISSEMEGSIDNDASLGYLEWVFEFKNDHKFAQSEAIGQIQLPPNAVVSRLTLWIDGEEREAAYAERNRVTQAYEKIVSSRRDPVLVTTSGKDRVSMKCFPVLPKGGIMKVKVGITFPLVLENKKSGYLQLPYFRDENFEISEDFKHKISILATNDLESNDKGINVENEDRFKVIRGSVANKDIESLKTSIRVVREDESTRVWAKYDNSYIKQEIIEKEIDKPSRYVFVIDTSVSMKASKNQIVKAIESLPSEAEVGLVLTHGNGLNAEISNPKSHIGNASEIAEKIKNAEFGGGTDNLPALTKAWDMANESNKGVVIWVHAPQSFKFRNSETLAKKLVRRSNNSEIYNLSISTGGDDLQSLLADLNFIKNVTRFGDVEADLSRLFSQLEQTKQTFGYARTIDTEAKETVDKKTSKHMIRLWAFDEINEVLDSEKDEKSAIELALQYQLVTPVTGAVVLETQQQYDEAGLKPVKKPVIHAVPEPQTYVLMIIGLIFIIWVSRKQFG